MKNVFIILSALFSLSASAMELVRYKPAGEDVVVKISVNAAQGTKWRLYVSAGNKSEDINGIGKNEIVRTYAAKELNVDCVGASLHYGDDIFSSNIIGGIQLNVDFYQNDKHLDGGFSVVSSATDYVRWLSDSAVFVDENAN